MCIKITGSSVVMPCNLVAIYQHFWGTCCFRLHWKHGIMYLHTWHSEWISVESLLKLCSQYSINHIILEEVRCCDVFLMILLTPSRWIVPQNWPRPLPPQSSPKSHLTVIILIASVGHYTNSCHCCPTCLLLSPHWKGEQNIWFFFCHCLWWPFFW